MALAFVSSLLWLLVIGLMVLTPNRYIQPLAASLIGRHGRWTYYFSKVALFLSPMLMLNGFAWHRPGLVIIGVIGVGVLGGGAIAEALRLFRKNKKNSTNL